MFKNRHCPPSHAVMQNGMQFFRKHCSNIVHLGIRHRSRGYHKTAIWKAPRRDVCGPCKQQILFCISCVLTEPNCEALMSDFHALKKSMSLLQRFASGNIFLFISVTHQFFVHQVWSSWVLFPAGSWSRQQLVFISAATYASWPVG